MNCLIGKLPFIFSTQSYLAEKLKYFLDELFFSVISVSYPHLVTYFVQTFENDRGPDVFSTLPKCKTC